MRWIIAQGKPQKRGQPFNRSALVLIIFMIFSLVLVVLLVGERTIFFGRAQVSIPGGPVSLENSYVFASPLSARADGKEKIRITVFLLDDEGLGVAGKRVYLGQVKSLRVKEVQPVTDSLGKAIFDLSSTKKGEYFIEVGVERKILPQKARVSFW